MVNIKAWKLATCKLCYGCEQEKGMNFYISNISLLGYEYILQVYRWERIHALVVLNMFCTCTGGKEFMHQYTLMRHLPTHTDERNFRCNQCGKAFRQMSTLSQHKATHSEVSTCPDGVRESFRHSKAPIGVSSKI